RRPDSISDAERRRKIRPMEQGHLSAFLTAAQTDARHYPLFLLLARTGLRPGEAYALQGVTSTSAHERCAWRRRAGGPRRLELQSLLVEEVTAAGAQRRPDRNTEAWTGPHRGHERAADAHAPAPRDRSVMGCHIGSICRHLSSSEDFY